MTSPIPGSDRQQSSPDPIRAATLDYVLGPEHGAAMLRLARRTARTCGICVTAIGLLGIAGWLFGVDALTRVFPDSSTMKFNTAIALAAAGIGLVGSTRRGSMNTGVTLAAGAIAALIGVIALAQSATGWDMGIDELFVSDRAPRPGGIPGRMAAHTALACLGAGAAIIMLDTRWRIRSWPAHVLAGGVAAIALLALASHLYVVPGVESTTFFAGMAVHAAAAFLLLAFGIFAARPYSGIGELLFSPTLTSQVARRWLVGAVVVPLVLGYVVHQIEVYGLLDSASASALFVGAMTVLMTVAVVAESAVAGRLEGKRLEWEKERVRLVTELEGALAEVRSLSGLLPICSHCKRIRDDRGDWERLELYISERSEAQFSHSLCPDCLTKHYGDLI